MGRPHGDIWHFYPKSAKSELWIFDSPKIYSYQRYLTPKWSIRWFSSFRWIDGCISEKFGQWNHLWQRWFQWHESQNPDLGFPEGRLHQTERAGIAKMLSIFTKMTISLISIFYNWNVGICLGAFSTYPKIQISKQIQISKKIPLIYIKKCWSMPKIC